MNSPRMFNAMSVKEQSLFARRLSFLIRADVPLLEALTIMQRQSRKKHRKQMFAHIVHAVSQGQLLCTSMEPFRHLFGDFAIDIIRVGEESGMLDDNLTYLADELQKRQVLQRKIIGALIYPAFITLATIGITGLITVYIFPKILPIFKTMHVGLPITTRILMGMSDLLIHHGLLILGILMLVIGSCIAFLKYYPSARFHAHRLALSVPLLGRLLKSYFLANFCRTLGVLMKSHFDIMPAIEITANTTSHLVYRKEIHALTQEMSTGKKISSHLEQHRELFPEMISEMVAIGEKTGNLSGTLLYLAGYYENEVEEITKNLSSSIEPVLMVIMGAIVGFVAISVITPVYAITQNIHH